MRPLHPPAPAAPRRVPFPAGLYLILDPAVAGLRLHPPAPDVPSRVSFPALAELVTTALTTGVRLFQLRMKTPHAGEFYDLAAQSCALVRAGGGTFIVNDRVDVAQAVGADGVHLGQEDVTLADARKIMGPDKLIGISTHDLKQAVEAEAGGADYIGFGPIFPTTTKEHPDPVVGLAGLREVRAKVRLPIVAIGGITTKNVREVVAAGADCVAVISAVLAAPDPGNAMAELVKEIEGKV
ncbi:MAG: thiamine phosphate synthase [Nitrospirae bacterium]|nr:MAG: thiamine phosphate synthase [Nitrospirota bacterium]